MTTGVLILRPRPAADSTAELAFSTGIAALVWPLFEIRPKAWSIAASGASAILLTSANAPRVMGMLPEELSHLPAYCVGTATADAAQHAGFNVIFTGERNVTATIDAMAASGHEVALHIRGEHVTAIHSPMTLIPVITYVSAILTDQLPPTDILESHVILLHSTRAAARFAELIDGAAQSRSTVRAVAISAAVAKAAGSGWNAIALAKSPNDAAMIDAARILAGS